MDPTYLCKCLVAPQMVSILTLMTCQSCYVIYQFNSIDWKTPTSIFYTNMADEEDASNCGDEEEVVQSDENVTTWIPYRKFRSIKHKKRKGFAGTRNKPYHRNTEDREGGLGLGQVDANIATSTKKVCDININEEKVQSASFLKMMNSSFDSDSLGPVTRASSASKGLGDNKHIISSSDGNIIIDKKLMMDTVNNAAVCRACKNAKAQLKLILNYKQGLAERYSLVCSYCHSSTQLETSPKFGGSRRTDGKGGKSSYEINNRSVVASLETGLSGLNRFCGLLNLPTPLSKAAYNKQLKHLGDVAMKNAKK